jgi:3-oxoacyl-[acyl-carrier-protein] synthase-3
MNRPDVDIGIVSVGTYLPENTISAEEIATASGLPEWVVRDKLGITYKHVAGPDDHPNQMAVWAVQDCLTHTEITPDEIDVVLCTTEEWKEYLLWTAGVNLAYEIGATRAWGMDLHLRCASTVGAMKLAKDMMIADPDVNTVLIAGGYRVGDFINFKNLDTTFMFNIGAGAGAMLLRRNWGKNRILGSHLISDGYMSNHVLVPASGTKKFPTDAAVAEGLFTFDLLEPEAMKNRLNAVSMDNWMKCIDEALRKSGEKPEGASYQREDISYLNILLIKPSGYREMLQRLGLTEDQSIYLGEIGHVGEQDCMFSIQEGLKFGRLKDGDLMAIIAAGIGYVWGATIVQWGPSQV